MIILEWKKKHIYIIIINIIYTYIYIYIQKFDRYEKKLQKDEEAVMKQNRDKHTYIHTQNINTQNHSNKGKNWKIYRYEKEEKFKKLQ